MRSPSRFDPAKDAINQAKHDVPLSFGDAIFADRANVVLETVRAEDNEDRLKVVGMVGGKLFTGVFVWRDDLPRFISVRRSNESEQRSYRNSR